MNTSPLLIIEFTLDSLKDVAAGSVFHDMLKSSYTQKPDNVRFTTTSSHIPFLISMSQLHYVHIPFDNDIDELNIKREDLVRQIKSARYFRRFTRVLIFVNSHSNEQGLIYHASDGATDFDEVSYCITS